MTGHRRVLALLAAAALAGACAPSGPAVPWTAAPASRLDLRLDVSPTTVTLLQPFTVTLDLWRAEGVAVDFAPALPAEDFAVTTKTWPETPWFGGIWQRTVLTCRPLRGPGDLVLPSFVARQRDGGDAASTPERTIPVTSTLAGAGPELEPPGEPFPTPFAGWGWLAAGAAALLAGGAAWRLLRGRRGGRPQAAEVELPPHVKALRALQRLRGSSRTTRAEVEAFYVDVSRVLRDYLEERFGLRAPERTTEEFLRELEGGDQLARDHRAELERFLSQCDLVKFAAHVPTEHDHLTTWGLAAAFVEATRGDRAVAEVAR